MGKAKRKYIQSKKWFLTQNNPAKYGLTFEQFQDNIKSLNPVWSAFSREIGAKSKLEHFHNASIFSSAIRDSTIHQVSPHSNNQKGLGNPQEMKDYIFKTGKWEETSKKETLLEAVEFGNLPLTSQEKSQSINIKMLEDIKSGKSVIDIIEETPALAFRVKQINELRQKYLARLYLGKSRPEPLLVIYRQGKTGTGKSRKLVEEYGNSAYKVSVYRSGRGGVYYDGFDGHKVLAYEEFSSKNVPIAEILNITDRYYTELDCRYQNAVGIYDVCIFNSNINFEKQYEELKWSADTIEQYYAWVRRISFIEVFRGAGIIERYTTDEYLEKYGK